MKYKFSKIDWILMISTIISILIIVVVGLSIGVQVPFKSWDVVKVNYFMSKSTELAGGVIISVLFYYLLVVIPGFQKYETVKKRINNLVENAQINQNRVISKMLTVLSYDKYYHELIDEDYLKILKQLDSLIVEDKKKFMELLMHWYSYTLLIERYLNKLLSYYKEHLSIEALVYVEELLESLYLVNVKDLPHRIEHWDPSKDKHENILNNFKEFDLQIRRLDKLI